jgi:hypothetical protein
MKDNSFFGTGQSIATNASQVITLATAFSGTVNASNTSTMVQMSVNAL